MTYKEIVIGATKKAEKNRFDWSKSVFECEKYEIIDCNGKYIDFYSYSKCGSKSRCWIHINELIFNQDFTKALWGTEPELHRMLTPPMPAWRFHSRDMLLAEDRLKYIEKSL